MTPGIQIILWHFDAWSDGIVYSPSLDFSDARNSQYAGILN